MSTDQADDARFDQPSIPSVTAKPCMAFSDSESIDHSDIYSPPTPRADSVQPGYAHLSAPHSPRANSSGEAWSRFAASSYYYGCSPYQDGASPAYSHHSHYPAYSAPLLRPPGYIRSTECSEIQYPIFAFSNPTQAGNGCIEPQYTHTVATPWTTCAPISGLAQSLSYHDEQADYADSEPMDHTVSGRISPSDCMEDRGRSLKSHIPLLSNSISSTRNRPLSPLRSLHSSFSTPPTYKASPPSQAPNQLPDLCESSDRLAMRHEPMPAASYDTLKSSNEHADEPSPCKTVLRSTISIPSSGHSSVTSQSILATGNGHQQEQQLHQQLQIPVQPRRKRGRPRNEDRPATWQAPHKRPQARQPHNVVEKKYREGLNNELEKLRRAVPGLPNDPVLRAKIPKGQVLSGAADELVRLQKTTTTLMQERDHYKLQYEKYMAVGTN